MQIPECPAPMIAMRVLGCMWCVWLGTAQIQSSHAEATQRERTLAGSLRVVQEAVARGYKVVTENGQSLHCRKDVKTGSRVQSNLTCLSKDQLAAQRRGAIDYVTTIQKGNPNPLDN